MTNIKKRFVLRISDILPFAIWITVFYFTWLFMHGADHFLTLEKSELGKYFDYKWFLIAHITAGGGSLLLGLIQFWPRLRTYNWKLHRIIGTLYLTAVLVSSISAVVLAFTTANDISWVYAFSLQVWVTVWITATAIAYYAAIKKKFVLHREWMVRSYLVTLAFIISGLTLKIPSVQQLGTYSEVSSSLFWMGWSVPLYVYQVFLAGKKGS
jgi:uncharacterized membrane protein